MNNENKKINMIQMNKNQFISFVLKFNSIDDIENQQQIENAKNVYDFNFHGFMIMMNEIKNDSTIAIIERDLKNVYEFKCMTSNTNDLKIFYEFDSSLSLHGVENEIMKIENDVIKFNDQQSLKIQNDDEIKTSICDASYDNIGFNESYQIDEIRRYVENVLNNVSNHVDGNTSLKIKNMLNEFDSCIELMCVIENMFDEHNHGDDDDDDDD